MRRTRSGRDSRQWEQQTHGLEVERGRFKEQGKCQVNLVWAVQVTEPEAVEVDGSQTTQGWSQEPALCAERAGERGKGQCRGGTSLDSSCLLEGGFKGCETGPADQGGGWGPMNGEEAGSGQGLGEGEESTGFRVILEAEWNIRRGGCQDGGGAGSWAGREAQKVMGGGGA